MTLAEWVIVAVALLGLISIAGSLGRCAAALERIATESERTPGAEVIPITSGESN